MKIEIYKEKKEKTIRLKFFQSGNEVILSAVDAFGDTIIGGNLLCISSEGKLILCTSINPDLGLTLNEKGQLELHN